MKYLRYVCSLSLVFWITITPVFAYDDSWHPEFVGPKGDPLLLNFLEGMENLINYSCEGSKKSKNCIHEGKQQFITGPELFDWIFLPMCDQLDSEKLQHKCMLRAYSALEKLSKKYNSRYLNGSYWAGFPSGKKPWGKCVMIKDLSKSLNCLKSSTESQLESYRNDH